MHWGPLEDSLERECIEDYYCHCRVHVHMVGLIRVVQTMSVRKTEGQKYFLQVLTRLAILPELLASCEPDAYSSTSSLQNTAYLV